MKVFKTRNILSIIAITFTVLLGYLYSLDFRPVIFNIAESTVKGMIVNANAKESDFQLLFCGTGSPNRSTARGQPCAALVANGKLFLFDAGEGAIGKLIEYSAPIGSLDTVFLTHLHSDHISGVAEVLHNTWLFGLAKPANVIGPPGTHMVLEGFDTTYKPDMEERSHTMGDESNEHKSVFSTAQEIQVERGVSRIVYDSEGLIIRAFRVDHPTWEYAYGYRIEYLDKVVVISGDTSASDGIRTFSKNADILVHEAMNIELFTFIGELMAANDGPMTIERVNRIASLHTPTLEIAEIARDANVRNLILTHLIPAVPDIWFVDRFFTSGMRDIYKGNLIVARDGQWIEVDEL